MDGVRGGLRSEAKCTFGRHAEVAFTRQVEIGVERLQPRYQGAPEARIVERDVARLAIAPALEAVDHDGAVHEVDLGPRTERPDQLALSEVPLGPRHLATVGLLRAAIRTSRPAA